MRNVERVTRSPEIVAELTKLLLLDLYDTSVNLDGLIKALVSTLKPGIDAQAFLSGWIQQYVALVTAVRERTIPYADLNVLMRKGLDAVLLERKFGPDGLSQEDKDNLMRAWYEPEPWPDTREGLQRLQAKGYKLAIMSNASRQMQESIAAKIGIKFDYSFFPATVQTYKPNPEMYRQALQTGFEPAQIAMVSHYPPDMVTAGSVLGYNTIYVERGRVFPQELDFRPDVTVADFIIHAELFGA